MRDKDDEIPEESISREGTEARLSPELQLTSGLSQFAGSLGAFAARSVGLDRDALLFAAGQASTGAKVFPARSPGDRRARAWQAATAAMSLVAGCLAMALVMRPVPEPRVVIVERERVPTETSDHVPASQGQSPETFGAVNVNRLVNDDESFSDDDQQLAEAWKARQELIADSDWMESRLALAPSALQMTIIRDEGPRSSEPPLTRAGVMGEGSRNTIQRLLGEKL